ncbi:Uncharacterised protein [Chlamydia trachomatis]|nr:Uncharacterised protein [Chlamydia trachomatis]
MFIFLKRNGYTINIFKTVRDKITCELGSGIVAPTAITNIRVGYFRNNRIILLNALTVLASQSIESYKS